MCSAFERLHSLLFIYHLRVAQVYFGDQLVYDGPRSRETNTRDTRDGQLVR